MEVYISDFLVWCKYTCCLHLSAHATSQSIRTIIHFRQTYPTQMQAMPGRRTCRQPDCGTLSFPQLPRQNPSSSLHHHHNFSLSLTPTQDSIPWSSKGHTGKKNSKQTQTETHCWTGGQSDSRTPDRLTCSWIPSTFLVYPDTTPSLLSNLSQPTATTENPCWTRGHVCFQKSRSQLRQRTPLLNHRSQRSEYQKVNITQGIKHPPNKTKSRNLHLDLWSSQTKCLKSRVRTQSTTENKMHHHQSPAILLHT